MRRNDVYDIKLIVKTRNQMEMFIRCGGEICYEIQIKISTFPELIFFKE